MDTRTHVARPAPSRSTSAAVSAIVYALTRKRSDGSLWDGGVGPLLIACRDGGACPGAPHKVVPLNEIPSEQWIEVVSGDPSKAGSAFVLRIHNDAGYVCPPHTHPTDENIVVVQGSWSVGIGTRINLSTVQPLELGAYALVPAKMAHFCRSKTETIIQVHGVGPFSVDMVMPMDELTDEGVNRMMSMGALPQIGGTTRPVALPSRLGIR